jgi:hypothetical protein
MTYQLKGGSILSNEIGKWYDIPIHRDVMEKYMTKWMLTGYYEVDESCRDEHIYFNFALGKYYVQTLESGGLVWYLRLADEGRNFLNKGEKHEQ